MQGCVAGEWIDDGECDDPDECVDNQRTTETCDLTSGESGILEFVCDRGRWEEEGVCGRPAGVFTDVAIGYEHAVATTASGTVVAWGGNRDRQLGDDSRESRPVPVVSSLLAGTTTLGVGRFHSCGILAGGGVRCVGQNGDGQLGDGADSAEDFVGYSLVAVDVRRVTNAVEVDGGRDHTCALTLDHEVWCWGGNSWGQIGENPPRSFDSEANLVGGLPPIAQLAVGSETTCVRSVAGEAWCWGHNTRGEVGNGTTGYRVRTPERVVGLERLVDLSAGEEHACAVRDDGAIFCWGQNNYGQVGDGTSNTDRLRPTRVVDVDDGVQVAAGTGHTCALRSDGTVACWGWNSYGQSGSSTIRVQPRPVAIAGLENVQRVVVGHTHSCAHVTGGALQCWGQGGRGERGDGTMSISYVPTLVLAPAE